MPPKNHRLTGAKKRKRTVLSNEQVQKLEEVFNIHSWPAREVKQALCRDINMSEHFVNTWFQNRRAKIKRENELRSKINNGADEIKENVSSTSVASGSVSPHIDNDEIISVVSHSSMNENDQDHSDETRNDSNSSMKLAQTSSTAISNQTKPTYVMKNTGMNTIFISSKVEGNGSSSEFRPIQEHALGEHIDPRDTPIQHLLKLTQNINVDQMKSSVLGHEKTLQSTISTSPALESYLSRYHMTAPSGTSCRNDKKSTKWKSLISINTCEVTRDTLSQLPDTYSRSSHNPPTLFHSIINMVAIKEGGIIPVSHEDFGQAVNDALYGIKLSQSSRLTYSKEAGFNVMEEIKL